MGRSTTTKRQKSDRHEARELSPFRRREAEAPTPESEHQVHLLRPGIVCDTERRGLSTPAPQAKGFAGPSGR
jgi:hypothetical protein